MKRAFSILTVLLFALVLLPGVALAAPVKGKVVSAEADKVVVQLPTGKGAAFPVGMRDVEVKKEGAMVVRGRITASSGDKISLKVVKGKSAGLSEGDAVEIEQSASAEGIDGC